MADADALLDNAVVIASRDLEEQKETGNGERLSAIVPDRPLMVNNGLLFGMMSSPQQVAVGAGLTVETNRKNAALFASMPPLGLEGALRQALQRIVRPGGRSPLNALAADGRKLRVEPYCYLYGHPDATLETRLRATIVRGAEVLWQQDFKIATERLPIEGAGSWSEDRGRRLRESALAALPQLVDPLLAALP